MTREPTASFARRLRELRTAAGLTQQQLADVAGITQATLSRLEAGTQAPGWDTVQAVAAALGVSTEAFRDSQEPIV